MGVLNNFLKIINFNKCEYLIENKNFLINYSTTLGRPIWTAYSLDKQKLKQTNGGRTRFRLDQELLSENIYQLDPNSPIFSKKWSRGHLIPSFLMSWDKTKNGSWSSTYKMSNIIPQNPTFNMNNWNKLEIDTFKFIRNNNFTTNIITGCANHCIDKKCYLSDDFNFYPNTNFIWVDKNCEFEYLIPSIMYQLVITPYEVFCWVGTNNQSQQIERVKLSVLEQIIGINFNL